jgi:TilS substrate binding domain
VRLPSSERLEEALRQLLHAGRDRHPAIDFGGLRLLRERDRVELRRG